MTTRARFIRGVLGLAFAASVAIRGAAQDSAAGRLWRRVPSVIRIPAHLAEDFFAVLPARQAAAAATTGLGAGHVKYEVVEEVEEPDDFDPDDVGFRITLYDPKTDSFIARRTA